MAPNHRTIARCVCLTALLLLSLPPVTNAAVETRATVRSDFVVTSPVEPVELSFSSGTELDYRGSLGNVFLVATSGTGVGPWVVAVPKEVEGKPAASVSGNRLRIAIDLRIRVEHAYHIFRQGMVFAVEQREGSNLLVRMQEGDPASTVEVPAARFTVERVLASGGDDGSDSSQSKEEAYAAELNAHLAANPPGDLPQSVAEAVDAVCLITQGESAGTGFLMVMDGRVYCMTNHHVIGAAQNLEITSPDGRTFTPRFHEVAADRDLARILIEETPPALTRMGKPLIGDSVSVVGNREGLGVVRTEQAKVIGFAPGIIELDNEFARGNSGSPVIREDGVVVGVATFLATTEEAHSGEDGAEKKGGVFDDRYFATQLDDEIEWVPVSPALLNRMHTSIRKDDIFTADAFALLQAIAETPYTPVLYSPASSAALGQWVDRYNGTVRHHREAAQSPSSQFANYQDFQAWQQQQALAYLTEMRELLRRLEHLSRSRLARLRSRMASFPDLGYYPVITGELIRRYEMLTDAIRVVTSVLEQPPAEQP